MKTGRITLTVCLLAMAVCFGTIFAIRSGALTPTDDYLKERFTDARSRFIQVDGVPMHVVEEGRGPVIILIHGYLASQRQWDGWADALRKDFRVVRFDYPPFGLSGPDPTGQYSSARAYPLIVRLIEELGYDRFHIGGTSSGAILAMRYAADHPEKVDKLLLSTVPAYTPGDRRPTPKLFSAVTWFSDTFFEVWRPQLYWRLFFENIFGQDDRITPEMVSEYSALNNRTGAISNAVTFVIANARSTVDVSQVAARVTVPTFIQWAGNSPVLTPAGLDRVAPMFTSTDVKIKRYPELGHMPMLEDPEQTVADAKAFLLAD
jgi:pimeloyl-ACP methyl ester carboxylesterase